MPHSSKKSSNIILVLTLHIFTLGKVFVQGKNSRSCLPNFRASRKKGVRNNRFREKDVPDECTL